MAYTANQYRNQIFANLKEMTRLDIEIGNLPKGDPRRGQKERRMEMVKRATLQHQRDYTRLTGVPWTNVDLPEDRVSGARHVPLPADTVKSKPLNKRSDSFKRLREERWRYTKAYRMGLTASGATEQSWKGGSGDLIYDEYYCVVEEMPPGVSPEEFLLRMASNLNGTVNDDVFDAKNVFIRKNNGKPKVGDVISIDIRGPDNGSVILAEMKSNYFVFQTVTTSEDGTHPEYGAREFGFERVGNRIHFYTRGVSRPENFAVGVVGKEEQRQSWVALVRGVRKTIEAEDGRTIPEATVHNRRSGSPW